MQTVTYRPINPKDYHQVKQILCEAFYIEQFVENPKVLDAALTLVLQGTILSSTYTQVAVINDEVVGIILASAKSDKVKYKAHNILSILKSLFVVVFSDKKTRAMIKDGSKIMNCYKSIIKDYKDSFDGCIELFAVSEKSRGQGIGKGLMNGALTYLKQQDVSSLYLYTDTFCNYGFYDSQNFERLNEASLKFETVDISMDVFLYRYTFKGEF